MGDQKSAVRMAADIAKKRIKKIILKWMFTTTGLLVLAGFFILLIIVSAVTANNSNKNSSSQISSDDIINRFVETACAEAGTVGGDKYSTYYHGHPTGLSWCSMFVSWAANEVGLIEQGIIPKEQLCYNGIQWFKKNGQFQYTDHYGGSGYTPKRGDIIYFTWNKVKDPLSGHVGIVMYVEEDNVITIEGNTNNNRVAVRKRNRHSATILGYGTPDYTKAAGSGNIKLEGNSTAEQVWNFFKAHGFSDAATAGIMGNIQQESSMNPAAIESNGEGHGICQWSFGRKQTLFDRAAAAGKPWQDLEVQLNLLYDELNGLDSATKSIMDKKYGGLENFKQATSISWAVEAFEKSFERAGKPMLDRRIKYAEEYYNQFTGG